MSRRRPARVAAALALLASLALAAAGADAQQPAAPEPAALQPPQGHPLDQVIAQAGSLEQRLKSLQEFLVPTPEVLQIESQLSDTGLRLAALREETDPVLSAADSLDAIGEAERRWLVEGDALDLWEQAVDRRLGRVAGWSEVLQNETATWAATDRRAQEEQAPPALQGRIGEMVQALARARADLATRRNQLLELETRVSGLLALQAEGLERVQLARGQFRASLLERDAPALWDAWSGPQGSRGQRLREVLIGHWERLRQVAVEYRERIVLHTALFLALGGLFSRLGRRARKVAADDERKVSMVVFERPFSSALLIAVLLTPAVFPRIPAVAVAFNSLLFLIPALRLLPELVGRPLRPAVYGLAGLIAFDQVRQLLEALPAVDRAVLSLEIAVGAGLLGWMLRPARLAALPAGARLHRGLGVALRISLIGLILALLAGLLGWVQLGQLIGEGLLRSAALALVTYGAWRVVRAGLRVGVRSEAAGRLDLFRYHGWRISRVTTRVLGLAAFATWLAGSLRAFGALDELWNAAAAAMAASLSFGTVTMSLGDVVSFALTITVSIWLARLLRFLLDVEVLPRARVRPGAAHAISATTGYVVLVVGFFLAASAVGIDFNRFTLLAGALGVGVGFGLQNLVNNFVSGLILLFERPIQLGDQIEVGSLLGEVKRIGIRSSTVRTWQGAEVIVPNGQLVSESVVNWTHSDRHRRLEISVGVAYGTDPKTVLEILQRVATENPDVLDTPAPRPLFVGFGDSSLDFELRAWTGDFERYRETQSAVTVAIEAAIREAGIEIPFPQRDLHLKSVKPQAAKSLLAPGHADREDS